MPSGIYKRTDNMKTGQNMFGKKHSKETKKKMSLARIGKKHSEETKKKISKNHKGRSWGHKYQKGHKQLNSGKTHFKKDQMSGNKHWNWKGGITKLNHLIRELDKYKQWRSDVFKRDNWICQTCGNRGGTLEAHHSKKKFITIIREYNIKTIKEAINCKELWDIDNGVTLCYECHRLTKKR